MELKSISTFRSNIFNFIKMVIGDNTPMKVSSKGGNVVILSEEDYNAMQETFYLLKSPKNAQILLDRLEDFQSNKNFNEKEF